MMGSVAAVVGGMRVGFGHVLIARQMVAGVEENVNTTHILDSSYVLMPLKYRTIRIILNI